VVGNRGVVTVQPDVLDRLARRANFEFPTEPPTYTDRFGKTHLPFDVALLFAQAFAKAEPRTVLLEVESEERRYETEARDPANSDLLPLIRRWRAHWALCRDWSGSDQTLAQRDEEIERLRRILDELRYELIRTDQIDLVSKLDRRVRGG
jgi:hypothetical protein